MGCPRDGVHPGDSVPFTPVPWRLMDLGSRDVPKGQPGAELTRAKVRVPRTRAGSLERGRLLGPLMSVDDTGIVVVRAPAGSGKTTLLAHWASVDRARDFAWVSLDETDNDVVTFWRHVVDALGAAAPEVAAYATELVGRASPDVTGAVIPAVLTSLAERDRPLVLILDDYQSIADQACHDSLRHLTRRLVGHSALVVSSRTEPPLNLARLSVEGRARIISPVDLAFTTAEVVQLLARHGLRPTEAVSQLLSDTEGWATGVGLSIVRAAGKGATQRSMGGPDLIREFLVEEVLEAMDPADRDFLRRCSVLTTLSTDLCAQVTEAPQSGRRLAALSTGNVLITRVDRESQTYRVHQLLRDVLQNELREADPEANDRAHTLAAQWFLDQGRPIEAVEHALRVSTPALAADTIAACWFETIMSGNLTTVARWLHHFDDTKLRAFPFVLIAAAWTAGFQGDWTAAWRYSRASQALAADGTPPDGTASFRSARALMLAGLGLDGITDVRKQAEIAFHLEGPDSSWHPLAAALLGAANLAAGRNDEARPVLSQAATAISGPVGVATYAMGQLAILEGREQRWTETERLARQAIDEIERLGLENLVSSGAAYVMYAAAAAHRGDLAIARRRLQSLNPILPSLSTAMPFDAFQIHLLTAETNAAIGEQRAAAVHAEAAQRHQELLTDAGIFEGRLAALTIEKSPEAGTTRSAGTSPTLTARELDVLTLLPTALSLREVGDHLYVSRDTVKTYVTRIYRKLGVSSRSAAITRATDLGLLERPERGTAARGFERA